VVDDVSVFSLTLIDNEEARDIYGSFEHWQGDIMQNNTTANTPAEESLKLMSQNKDPTVIINSYASSTLLVFPVKYSRQARQSPPEPIILKPMSQNKDPTDIINSYASSMLVGFPVKYTHHTR